MKEKRFYVAYHYNKRGLLESVTGFGSCITATENDFVFTQTGILALTKSIEKDYNFETVVIINIIPLDD